MEAPDEHAKPVEDDETQYMSCKGLLAYAGLQRAMGKEPRCVGFKTRLPPNIIITEEDVVPPPPEDAKFVFLGIGVSVYNKEMLSKNRLPLVNGFSQLVVSKDYERDEQEDTSPRDGEEEASSGGAGGRRHGHRHRQPPPPPHPVEAPTGVVGVAAGRGQQQQQRPQQGSAVPATLSQRSGVSTGGSRDEGEGGGPTNRDQLEALTNYAVGRVQKQVDITKQVVEELKKLTPRKLREAAVVQANKVQEMPTLLMDTSKRMVASGMKFVRNHMDEQDRKK